MRRVRKHDQRVHLRAQLDETARLGVLGHEAQRTQLTGLIGNRTDADMAQAVTDLNLSQIAIQASAQVINQLRAVSLLNLLSTG